MKPTLIAGLVALALASAASAQAQTLRFASQGDPQTMDPHSQNESFTNSSCTATSSSTSCPAWP
jgi:peptide/nickel transport system substrate-binding protein